MTKHIIDSELLEDCLIAAQGPINGHLNDRLRALLQAPAKPDQVQGWQMVPVKITPAMENADPYGMGYGRLHAIWSSLLAAAPQPSEVDAKDALIAKLTAGLNEAKYRIEQGRIWNGMGWTLTGLHPHHQQQAIDAIDAAMAGVGYE